MPKDKPFPHLNDTDTFRKMVRRRLTFALATPMVVLSLIGLILLLRKRRRGYDPPLIREVMGG